MSKAYGSLLGSDSDLLHSERWVCDTQNEEKSFFFLQVSVLQLTLWCRCVRTKWSFLLPLKPLCVETRSPKLRGQMTFFTARDSSACYSSAFKSLHHHFYSHVKLCVWSPEKQHRPHTAHREPEPNCMSVMSDQSNERYIDFQQGAQETKWVFVSIKT